MNRHTFKDAVSSRRDALANEVDDDDEGEEEVGRVENLSVDGEEDDGNDKFNDAGEVLEPFNLREEREGGNFDSSLNYVWHKEKGEIDRWCADLDEAEMEKSIGEAARLMKLKQERQSAEEAKPDPHAKKDKKTLIKELLSYLQSEETVLQGIRRIGREAKGNPKLRSSSSATINLLTELADALLAIGELSIYDIPREGLELMIMNWEYTGQDGKIHGPFSSAEMSSWIKQGYFSGENAVYMREYRKEEAVSKEIEKDFDSDDDNDDKGGGGGESETKEPHPALSSSTASSSLSLSRYSNWTLSDEIDFSVMNDTSAPETERGKKYLMNRREEEKNGNEREGEGEGESEGRPHKRRRNEMKDEEDSGED